MPYENLWTIEDITQMTVYIGDCHGKFNRYEAIIKEHRNTIQVGDMGIGFRRWPHGDPSTNPPYDKMVASGARFIRGNHDNPVTCRNHSQGIPDGYIENDTMFIGGGFSIDYMYRNEGFSWWKDEELSPEQFENMIDVYRVAKPKTMVTHDCPLFLYGKIHEVVFKTPSRTPEAFDRMFGSDHRPELWVFGHHHKSFDQIINGTRFVCLAELEVRDL